MIDNYYRILGLDAGADIKDVKKAFRSLAKKYHPDVNQGPGAEQLFIEINEAYELLINHLETSPKKESLSQEEAYRKYRDDIRERAARHAKMKYAKFEREHEAFKESGYYDLSLMFKMLGRVFILFFAVFMYLIPVLLSLHDIYLLLLALFCWPVAIFQTLFIIEKRKNYFIPEKPYYNLQKIKQFYTERNEDPVYKCFYCKGLSADSKPFKIYLLRIKDVKTKSGSPFERRVSYKRVYKNIQVPRSRKALRIHSLNSAMKCLIVLFVPFFLPFQSILWKLLISVLIAVIVAFLINVITNTHSKVGYMLNWFNIIKSLYWILMLVMVTEFEYGFSNVYLKEIGYPILALMVFFDPLLELVLKLPGHKRMLKPILKRYHELDKYFTMKYQYYIDVPVLTLLYPFIKWLFG